MKLKIIILLFCVAATPIAYAKQCQIERLTSSQLNLSSSYLSQAATLSQWLVIVITRLIHFV